MYQTIKYRIDYHVATITLNIPKTLNAFNLELHEELHQILTEAGKDQAVRVIVITGEGKGFSSGADIGSFGITEGNTMDYGEYLRKTYNKLIGLMKTIRKPIIAAINGVAAGAGLSLALACDFRLASSQAKMSMAFIKIGLIPDAGALFYLPRIVGLSKAMELAALGSTLNAEEAERIGLVNRVIQSNHFDKEVAAFAHQLVELPPVAFGQMKEIMYRSFENDLETVLKWEEEGQKIAGKSADHKEGVLAFFEKRYPQYKGI